jgi:hypothetical protein
MATAMSKATIHTMRYLRHHRGETVQDIARNEGVTVKAVEKSLRQVQVDHALNTPEQLEREAINVVRSNLPHVQSAISRALKAKTLIRETTIRRGKEETRIKTVDDIDTQLKGLKAFNDMLTATQPKGTGIAVNVNQQNANLAAAAATTNIRTTTYEDRLRRIRNQQAEYALMPSQVIDAPEATDEDDEVDPLDEEDDGYDDAESDSETE